jgi:hypothetical protein
MLTKQVNLSVMLKPIQEADMSPERDTMRDFDFLHGSRETSWIMAFRRAEEEAVT